MRGTLEPQVQRGGRGGGSRGTLLPLRQAIGLIEQQTTDSDADLVLFLCEVRLEIRPNTLNGLAIQDLSFRFVRVFFRI